MKWLINSMIRFWILLLAVSLAIAGAIYGVWLKGTL